MDNFIREFKLKAKKRQLKIAVVGLGYVGLPLAMEFVKKGFNVLGFDLDKDRVNQLKRKVSYITDVASSEVKKGVDSKKFQVFCGFAFLKQADVIFICVPTPLKRKYQPNISYITSAVSSIAKYRKDKALIVLESTTYPGTTEEIILPMLEIGRSRHGKDFYLCFSPERIDPGSDFPLQKIPKVVGGINNTATELTAEIYKTIFDKVVAVSSSRVAEMVKLLENTFRLINIGLIDELAMMAHKMDIDIFEVVNAAKTKPFGFMPFYPGPGVGGHCLDEKESVYIKEGSALKTMQMPDFIRHLDRKNNRAKILSFDPIKRKAVFKNVTAAAVRHYPGKMVNILTEDGRSLKVTDLHPMFVYYKSKWQLKYAKDLEKGDALPIALNLPDFDNCAKNAEIDILEEIKKNGSFLIEKVRVKPIGFSFRDYSDEIKSILRSEFKKIPDICWDYLSDNILPLKYFYLLEDKVNIRRDDIKLVTGRGPGYSEIPSKILMDNDFCRLIGYYISEGCYTKDKSARIRFSFNRSESEYIQDVVSIVNKLGIRASIYNY